MIGVRGFTAVLSELFNR